MTHNNFLTAYLSTKVDYDWQYWYQCTDLAKVYAQEVRWITPWTFWWSAKNADQSTFPWSTIFTSWPGKDLQQWDILIQWPTSRNMYGHVWIVHRADRFWYYLMEQNAVTGNWWWAGNDAVRINYYRWSERNILRFFRKI